MRYKIILSNTKETITIQEEELGKVLKGISSGSPVVVREGIFNPSYFVAILPDGERMKALMEAKNLGGKYEEPSPFAKLLAPKMEMLSNKARTEVQEKVSGEIRPSGIR